MQTAIMDSSPQPAPVRRPLKRSASTASLPTPPYSQRGLKRRSMSRAESESEDDDEKDELDSDEEVVEHTEEDQHLTAKAKRLGLLGASEAPPTHKRPKLAHDKTTDTDTADAETTTAGPSATSAPISPPRSKRQTRAATKATAAYVAPRTPPPPRRAGKKKSVSEMRPVRGSPGNPFADDGRSVERPPPRRPSAEYEEKPTVDYVFRGVRATFENPLYARSPSVRRRAQLPMDDSDYSPDPAVPPRRLLFDKRDTRDSDDEDGGSGNEKVRPKRLFAAPSASAR